MWGGLAAHGAGHVALVALGRVVLLQGHQELGRALQGARLALGLAQRELHCGTAGDWVNGVVVKVPHRMI